MRRWRLGATGGGVLCLSLYVSDIRFVLSHLCKLSISISSEKLGCYVPGYRVRCTLTSGATSVQIYRPFLGEICRPDEHINTSPALCISRLKIAVYTSQDSKLYLTLLQTQAYARIDESSRIRVPWEENGIPIHEIWIKSKIMVRAQLLCGRQDNELYLFEELE